MFSDSMELGQQEDFLKLHPTTFSNRGETKEIIGQTTEKATAGTGSLCLLQTMNTLKFYLSQDDYVTQ